VLSRLLSDIQFLRAASAYRRKDLIQSRSHLNKYYKYRKKYDAIALAFDATLMLLEERYDVARRRFEEARLLDNKLLPEDDKYLQLYCQYYECLLGPNRPCDQYRRMALECKASSSMRRWLILSNASPTE